MAEKESKNKWHTPAERIMMLGFAAVILLGTILLCLPVSAADGQSGSWRVALVTAMTSGRVYGPVAAAEAAARGTLWGSVVCGVG